MPLVMEDYIHRIGRTGRAGESGTAYTIVSPDDKVHARQLVRILEEGSHNVPPELAKIAETAPVTKPSMPLAIISSFLFLFSQAALPPSPQLLILVSVCALCAFSYFSNYYRKEHNGVIVRRLCQGSGCRANVEKANQDYF